MTVYVDDMRAAFGRMVMCHMFADTDGELHQMAARIGVARRWHQRPELPFGLAGPGMSASWSHYDIARSKRALAVRYGAVEMRWRDLPRWLKEREQCKKTIHTCPVTGGVRSVISFWCSRMSTT